ncbi:Flp family type IVb pilin [Vibrio tasmaniensis]|uniref:Flp family type IVb pilin n=1 Tax=Vibrio tasmaniensis TaxID=212663 RepID=UPI00107F677C|nr:Flp family type IVb pilin [Vibrio tasmaniensis]
MYYKTLAKMAELKMKFEDDVRGVTAVEYAIIAVVMSGIILAAFQNDTISGGIKTALDAVKADLVKASK